jgi:hypothetical protein
MKKEIDVPKQNRDQQMKNLYYKSSVWTKVARSLEIQEEGKISEMDRLQVVGDYLK